MERTSNVTNEDTSLVGLLAAQPESRVAHPGWAVDVGLRFSIRSQSDDLSFESLHRIIGPSPEAHLAHAILFDAVQCYRKYAWAQRDAQRKLFREAREWLSTDSKTGDRLTCGFLCDSLGIDRLALIKTLREWYAREATRRVRAVIRKERPRREERSRDIAA